MAGVPSSSETKREVLRALLVEGQQTTKLVVDSTALGDAELHGFPARVIDTYPDGVPLDLNPIWPLEIDLDSDPLAMLVSLSFSGRICRCRVQWKAISMIAVGVGGVGWDHEELVPELVSDRSGEVTDPSDLSASPSSSRERPSHLRLLK